MRTRSGAALNGVDSVKKPRHNTQVRSAKPSTTTPKPSQTKRLRKGKNSAVTVVGSPFQSEPVTGSTTQADAAVARLTSSQEINEDSLPPSSLIPESLTPSDNSEIKAGHSEAPFVSSGPWGTFDSDEEEGGGDEGYTPSAEDPFGFVAAERKLKHRREALGLVPTFDDDLIPPPVQDSEFKVDEHVSPWKARRSQRNSHLGKSLRYSSLDSNVLPDTTRRQRSRIAVESSHCSDQPKVMKTDDLERLLPRRGHVKGRTKRSEGKRQTTKENEGVHSQAGPKKRSKQQLAVIESDMSEGETVGNDARILKVDVEQRKNLQAVEDYSLETETVIWL